MDVLWRIISLCGIAFLYCLLLVGVKKYHIKDMVKRMAKKEKVAMAAGVVLLCLGILMQIARQPLSESGGIVTDSINQAADWLFARNATASSLAVSIAVLVPAVLYQILFLEQIVRRCRIAYCQMYYFLILYVLNAGLYRNLFATTGGLLILLMVSALLYYGMDAVRGKCRKKDILYLLCLVAGIMLLALLEHPDCWRLYAVCGITVVEGLLTAFLRAISNILRKTLRKFGTLLLFIGFTAINYWVL